MKRRIFLYSNGAIRWHNVADDEGPPPPIIQEHVQIRVTSYLRDAKFDADSGLPIREFSHCGTTLGGWQIYEER